MPFCKILVFSDPDYPQACSAETIAELVPGEFQTADACGLATSLLEEQYDLLVSFHGPYFPQQAWRAILYFLEAGGNLAVFGGMPFTRPVNEQGMVEPEQQAYTDQLCLGPFFPLQIATTELHLEASEEAAFLEGEDLQIPAQQPGAFWSFYPRLTQVSDRPDELGSAGPLDTLLTPLLFACSPSSGPAQRVATPAVLLDQQSGRFQGGRWLLSPWQPDSVETWLRNEATIRKLILLAAGGPELLDIRPLLACYQPGEAPTLLITARARHDIAVAMSVQNPQGEMLESVEITLAGSGIQQEERVHLPAQSAPGLYRVVVHYWSEQGLRLRYETGFWVWDEALVEATRGNILTAGRDYFYQHGAPFPIYGTTYMDSRVQRKSLTLPNPARWDADFAAMKQAGVNTIRTGVWTAWRSEFMPIAGVANEAALRSLDAFVMTACKYNIQIIFTFFAFYPPLFEGENPWLDPRSLQGQQDFILAFVRRYRSVSLISWDLINEPGFGDPANTFVPRPIAHDDRFERAAFRTWLADGYSLQELRLRWRLTPADLPDWEQVTPPRAPDYNTNPRNTSTRSMLKVADFTAFSQEVFAQWAAKMCATIRDAGGRTLIGVGQDEAGARLAPQFYASAVDYTTTHPWWNNDDLLWDMLLDKTLTRPNLIQETGVMLVRDVDGRPWRSEQQSAYLLERKLVTGLIARGAGLIQWLWHTNAYMTSENENSIGLVRADGSIKPEMTAMLEFGRLMQAMQARIVEAETTPSIWAVIPYSQWFLRPELSIEATKQALRILGYDCGVIPQVVGEQQLVTLAQAHYRPRTIILPGVQYFANAAWQALDQFVQRGATLLVSGILTRDTHNLAQRPSILASNEAGADPTPVCRYEYLEDESGSHQLFFGNEKMHYVRKAHNRVKTYVRGAGKIVWCGLPLELSGNSAVIRKLYRRVLGSAARAGDASEESPLLFIERPLKDGTLALLVSESAREEQVKLSGGLTLSIAPNRAGAAIIDNDGKINVFGGVRQDS
jgi:hypothetical protein